MKPNNDDDNSLIYHLEALRSMILNSLIAVAILSPIGFFLAPKAIHFLTKISLPEQIGSLHYFSPMEVFIIQIKIGLLIAFILAFPCVINEIRKFLFPALYKHERKFISFLVLSSLILFLLGAILCIFAVLPLIMNFSASFGNNMIEATLGLGNFINLSIALILAFGIMFQFPLFVVLGVKFDLIEVSVIEHIRPYIIVAILIFAALLTPPDIISQLILAIPTYILFEIGIIIAKRI